MYLGQGYVNAQQRMFQMEIKRRIGYGEISEVIGEKGVKVDKFFRSLNFKQICSETLQKLDNNTLVMIESYVKGINMWISEKNELSYFFHFFDFQPSLFNSVDIVLFFKLFSFDFSSNINRELLRLNLLVNHNLTLDRIDSLIPSYPSDGPFIQSPNSTNSSSSSKNYFENNFFHDSFLDEQNIKQFFSSQNSFPNRRQSINNLSSKSKEDIFFEKILYNYFSFESSTSNSCKNFFTI